MRALLGNVSALVLAGSAACAQQGVFPAATPVATGFAAPTATVSATAVPGSASTAMRSDAAPALAAGAAAANLGFTPPSLSGTPTTGDCAKWASATALADAGAACGSGSGSGTPGGSSGQIEYNNAGAFGGLTPLAALGTIGAEPAVNPFYVSGNWYLPPYIALTLGTTLTAGRIVMIPMICPVAMTVKALGVRIGTAAASGNIQVAVYANNPATGRPTGAPLGSTGSISTVTAGPMSATPTGGNFTIPAGVYWDAINADTTAGGAAAMETTATGSGTGAYMAGSQTQSFINDALGYSRFAVYLAEPFGTWPTLATGSTTDTVTSGSAVIQLQSQ